MIEVEKKFILNEQDKERLTEGAEFVNEKVFTDTYYDTQDFSLTTNDRWLRCRGGKFELKIPLHEGVGRLADQYDELENEPRIREVLGLPSVAESFEGDLVKASLFPFCCCKTTRRKFKKGTFIIDLDVVDFQDFTYNIGEIELMVHEKSEIKNAVEKIIIFANDQKLTPTPVRGKIIEYLKRVKPDHYQALIRAGVVRDF